MFSFAFACLSDQPLEAQETARSMVQAWPGGAADGVAVASGGGAAAAIARWTVVEADAGVAPIWDAEAQTLVAGDVRLHNADEVAAALGRSDRRLTDLQLVSAAVSTWGEDAPRRFIGDFAFAVWNARERKLIAARDHMGLRPLYYHRDPAATLLASDVRQILGVRPSEARVLCDEKIADFFSFHFRTRGRSFFERIRLIKPGHYIVATQDSFRETAYWTMPAAPERPCSYADACAEVRALFVRAVDDRLRSDRPIVAHSSGGFDSSLIVKAADQLYRAGSARPPLVMASALTPGMPSDDSRYMDALARDVSFEGVRWSALDPELADIDSPMLASPALRRGPGGGPRGDLAVAHARGARVLLSGFGGDEVTYSWEIFRDLARMGRWLTLVNQATSVFGWARGARVALAAPTGFLSPSTVERLRSLRARVRDRPPVWMGPRLRAIWPLAEPPVPPASTSSHLRWTTWRHVTGAHTAAIIDAMQLYAGNDGVELRLPFADVRLIQRIVAVPPDQRLPNGRMRRLRIDALDPILPQEFTHRRGQGSWEAVFLHTARHLLPRIADLVRGNRWLSSPYVDQSGARALLHQVVDKGAAARAHDWYRVVSIGVLEAWLRAVLL